MNRPPNCFTATYSTRAGATSTDPLELDAFMVGKPAASAALAAPTTPPATTPTPMTAKEAVEVAGRTFAVVGAERVPTVVTRQRGAKLGSGSNTGGPVHVVRSTARVRSLAVSHDKVYDGYVAVFEAASGRMISACLGAGCRETS